MDILGNKVVGNSSTGERGARPSWNAHISDDNFEDYESMFKAFVSKMLDNRGSFKVNGDLLFEFVPKTYIRNDNLISSETSFYFHQFEEGSFINNDAQNAEHKKHFKTAESYNYQKNVPPIDETMSESISPAI